MPLLIINFDAVRMAGQLSPHNGLNCHETERVRGGSATAIHP